MTVCHYRVYKGARCVLGGPVGAHVELKNRTIGGLDAVVSRLGGGLTGQVHDIEHFANGMKNVEIDDRNSAEERCKRPNLYEIDSWRV